MSNSEEHAGLAEAEIPKEEEGESKWVIPQNLSLDKLDIITKACYQSGADKQPVDAAKISSAAGIHINTTIPNLRFLSAIGVLETAGARSFSLTSKGAEYAKQLSSNEIPNAGTTLKELLPSSHLKDLLDYLEVHKGSNDLTYENTFARIKTLARVKVDERGDISAPFKAGIRCLIALLGRTGFVPADISQQAEAGKPVGVPGVKKTVRSIRETPSDGKREEGESEMHKQQRGGEMHDFRSSPFNINITIEAKDPESIKLVRELVRELRGEDKDSSAAT